MQAVVGQPDGESGGFSGGVLLSSEGGGRGVCV